MKRYLLPFILLVALGFPLMGCGRIDTKILETSLVLDTDDKVGPYQVFAVVLSDDTPVNVWLVYTTDGWKKDIQKVQMNSVSRDVFQGEIPGDQPASTQIQYYILVQDSMLKIETDPPQSLALPENQEVPQDAMKLKPIVVGRGIVTYRFRILP